MPTKLINLNELEIKWNCQHLDFISIPTINSFFYSNIVIMRSEKFERYNNSRTTCSVARTIVQSALIFHTLLIINLLYQELIPIILNYEIYDINFGICYYFYNLPISIEVLNKQPLPIFLLSVNSFFQRLQKDFFGMISVEMNRKKWKKSFG